MCQCRGPRSIVTYRTEAEGAGGVGGGRVVEREGEGGDRMGDKMEDSGQDQRKYQHSPG